MYNSCCRIGMLQHSRKRSTLPHTIPRPFLLENIRRNFDMPQPNN